MSAKRQKKLLRLPPNADTREVIKLAQQGATYGIVVQLLQSALNQAQQSDMMKVGIAAYCEGRGLKGTWRLRVKGLQVSEASLVPVPDDNEEPAGPVEEPKAPVSAAPEKKSPAGRKRTP